jgi:monoamine oxidase
LKSKSNCANGFSDATEWYEIQQFNRRKFIKTAAISTIAFGFQSCTKKHPNDVKVAIVGAGFAGLNAAYTLKNKGINATVFEATKRVGGRVFTGRNIVADGVNTELGAEFIDTKHEDLWKLIREFGLQTIDLETDTTVTKNAFNFGNTSINDAAIIKAFQPYAAKFQAHIEGIKNSPKARREMDYISVSEYLDRILRVDGWLKDLLNVAYVTEYGRECSEQSSLNLLEVMTGDFSKGRFDPYGESDERYKIVGGNDQIATKLAEKLKDQIEYECILEAVKKDATGKYILTFKSDNKAFDVKADAVIMAIPCSILKQIQLDDSLGIAPEQKNAIQKYQIGLNGKFFFGNERPLWREQGFAGFLNTDAPYLQMGWDSSQLQGKTKAGYSVFYGGKSSQLFGESSINDLKTNVFAQLEKTFPGVSKVRNGKADRFHWPTNKFSKGSYSCHGLGHYHEVVPFLANSAGNLHFAGEHCNYEFQGFMNGALLTGREAAEKILKK